MLKKIVLELLLSFFVCFFSFALPGVQSCIKDNSGEYVYYKDKTFKNESIIGFLYYDEGTYAIRYFCPTNKKDITIYISINPANENGAEITGEKIIGVSSSEDADVVNYLHDLFYEFTSRRQKENLTTLETIYREQDFEQFGGKVQIKFNSYVPIFNIESIKSVDGSIIFSIETSGTLISSDDRSFTNFLGIDGLPKDKKRTFKKSKADQVLVEFESQTIMLDTAWKQAMDNLWLLGDSAILSMSTVKIPEDAIEYSRATLARRLCSSTVNSYSIWSQRKILETDKQTSVMNVFYQPDSENVTRDFKILTENDDGTISLLTLTIFESAYQKDRSYFSKIIRSYKAKN